MPSDIDPIRFNFYGLNCAFTTSDAMMAELAAAKWSWFQAGATHHFEECPVEIAFGGDWPQPDERHVQLSSHSWSGADQLIVDHAYFGSLTRVRLTLKQDQLTSIQLVTRPSLLFRTATLATRGTLRRQLYQLLLKLYVEQSLLWYLTWKHRLVCLHAAAVVKEGRVLVFAGLNGVGKTSLALRLAQHGYQVFADNYILLDSQQAYFAPDRARLDDDQLSGLIDQEQRSESFGFGKSYVDASASWSDQVAAPVELITLVIRGTEWRRQSRPAREVMRTIQHLQRVHGESVELAVLSQLRLAKPSTSLPQCEYALLTAGPLNELPEDFI